MDNNLTTKNSQSVFSLFIFYSYYIFNYLLFQDTIRFFLIKLCTIFIVHIVHSNKFNNLDAMMMVVREYINSYSIGFLKPP